MPLLCYINERPDDGVEGDGDGNALKGGVREVIDSLQSRVAAGEFLHSVEIQCDTHPEDLFYSDDPENDEGVLALELFDTLGSLPLVHLAIYNESNPLAASLLAQMIQQTKSTLKSLTIQYTLMYGSLGFLFDSLYEHPSLYKGSS